MAICAPVLASVAIPETHACGRDSDYMIGERSYRIALPDGYDGAFSIPAIVFVHGYRGKADAEMRNEGLTALASDLGAALIAAQAAGPEWNIPNIPSVDALEGVDELAYFDALIEDVVRRFAIDRSRVLVAGFSSGAMMVWHLACYRGDSFAGFVPMSGTFWEPIPATCPTIPSNIIHYHGRNDPIVPLDGRQIKDAHQGKVREAIALIAGLSDYRPETTETTDDLECSRQVDGSHRLLELCLFTGKHELKIGNLDRAARVLGFAGPGQ